MKKLLICLMLCLSLVACSSTSSNIEGTLTEIMARIYEGIAEDEKPSMMMETEVTVENEQWYLGTDALDYKEALASESAIGSIPHSVVLIRMNEGANVEEAKALLKESVNPNKWICVGADEVIVESKGDLIIVILDGLGHAETLQNNFLNLD